MALDPSIILSGRSPDLVGQFGRGLAVGQQQNQIGQQNALAALYRDQGAGIMAGDPNALNALAAIDPSAAMGVQKNQLGMQADRLGMDSTRLGMEATQQRMDMLSRDEQRQIEAQAAQMSAEQRAQTAAQIEESVRMGMAVQTPQEWDAMMTAQGRQDLVGQFNSRQAIAAKYMTMADVIKMANPEQPDPTKGAPQGYAWADPANHAAGVKPLAGYEATPDEYMKYVREEASAGRKPLSRLEYSQAKAGKGFSVTTTDGTTVQYGNTPASGGKPTDANLSSAGYLQRMTAAEKVMDELSSKGTVAIGLLKGMAVDTRAEGYALSPTEQQLLQAQRDWVRAKLRRESGAVIGADEMAAEIRQYFPQPGEDEATAKQKREARKNAERQLQIGAGPSADQGGPLTDSGTPTATPSDANTMPPPEGIAPEIWDQMDESQKALWK